MTIIHKEDSKSDDDPYSSTYHCDSCGKDITYLIRITCGVCKYPITAAPSPTSQPQTATKPTPTVDIVSTDGPAKPIVQTTASGESPSAVQVDTNSMQVDTAPVSATTLKPPLTPTPKQHLHPGATSKASEGAASFSELDLCVECFCAGVEIKDHKKDHAYIVHEALNYPLFESGWTAQEELLMVDAMRTFGLGNWEQIADHIGSKEKHEVERHYLECFVNSPSWPLPNMETKFDKNSARSIVIRDPNPPVRKPERSVASGPANHEIQGFMPAREEFEHEFDNDAETVVKDMIFEETDTPQEVALKTTILNIYNTALDRRIERKRFIKDRKLTHDFRKILAIEKRRPREEREMLNRARVFAKLQTQQDFDQFIGGLTHEQKIRQKIAELQEYRRMGITTKQQAQEYEREKHQRLTMKASGLVFGRGGGRAAYQPFPQPARTMSTSSFGRTISHLPYQDMVSGNVTMSGPSSPSATGVNTPNLGSGAGGMPGGAGGGGVSATAIAGALNPSNTLGHIMPNATAYRRGTVQPLDISTSEGVELLLPNEQQLCSNLRIQPKAYLVIKETLLREYATQGSLQRKKAREMIKIDVNKTAQIYDLFVVNGWIKVTK